MQALSIPLTFEAHIFGSEVKSRIRIRLINRVKNSSFPLNEEQVSLPSDCHHSGQTSSQDSDPVSPKKSVCQRSRRDD